MTPSLEVLRGKFFLPALVVQTFKSVEALARKLPSRDEYLAFAKQIRAGCAVPLNTGSPVEEGEIPLVVSLADGRVASTVTRADWIRRRRQDAEMLRIRIARTAAHDVLVVSLPAEALPAKTRKPFTANSTTVKEA